MELEIENNGTVQATDGRIIAISDIRISSAANQDFIVGAAATASSAITITDDYVTPYITEANDIRIRIPSGFNMTWLTSGTSAVISGTASAKVSTTVSYEDGGKTLVINVTSNFAAGDSITVSGLSYTNFTAASYGDHLELEVDNDGTAVAEDDKYIAVGGRPTDPSMLAYGEGTVTTPRYRTWSGSAFSAEASANATDSTIKWTVLKSSPVANEVILGVFSSSSSRLYIQTWNSSGWTSSWNTTLSYSGDSRVFDIAYERSTGDAVVVFGHSTNKDLRYRKRVGGVWDGSDQIISAITPDDMPYRVRAEPHPTSDDIFVAINTNANSLYALRWNGASNTWDNGLKTTAGVNDKSTEGFDLAFEGASGNAFLVWGDASNNVKYRKFTTSWQAESTAYSGLADKVLWLVADYDRRSTSSDIAIGMLLNDGYLEFGAWNGSSWASRPTRIRGRDNTQRGIDVQFQKTTGTAIYAFCQFANPARMAWRTWSSSGGFGSVTVAEGDSGNLNLIQLKASPASNEMMAVYTDANADLFHRYYNGSIWSGLTTALETTVSDADKKEPFMFAWKLLPPTAVDLISFTAAGQKEGVAVAWETAQEAQNKGFNLYRAEAARGAYVKLNDGLIPATSLSGEGKRYEFSDAGAVRGRIYYYKLEDVDVSGAVSVHGPVCVDWDADGLPDDWEIAHGLNPAVNDADLDSDGDGLVNRLEYERGTDPFNPDTDGDGVPDGGEQKSPGVGVGVGADRGLHILSADSRGVTLELVTKSFDANSLVTAAGQEYERLRIPGYVHGYTLESGAPQVPLKGVLLDIPAGKIASLKVLDTQSRVLSGYRLYPAPRHQVREDNRVVEVFTLDEAAYRANAFYPYSDAELSTEYVYRGQTKQRLILHPLRFNPATGELLLHERMRVRVDFSDHAFAQGYGGQVRSAAAASHHAPAAVTAWAVPAGAAYKIITNGEGIYRITRDWLTAQGLEPAEIDAIDLSRVQLFNQGSEQTLHVVDDNGNNRLDAGDSIILYAAAVPAAYAKYAKHNVYWLVNGGSGSPLRMEMVDGTPAAGPLAVSHEFTLHHEQDQTYLQSAVGSDEMDRWIFSSIAAGTGFAGGGGAKSFTLPLPGTLSTGDLTIRMYSPYNMDHAAAVSLNGTALDSAAWSGIGSTEAQFAGVSLLDGNNTVSVTCQSGADKIAFDWYEVSYARDFEAAGDSLKFTHASGHRYQIGGFSTQDAVLYDISDPAAVKRVVGGTYSGSAPYILEVEPHGAAGAKTYLSVAPAALKTPVSVVKDSASSLADSGNAADWILITHRSLGWDSGGIEQSWVSSLVSLRQSQGLRTQVVDVQDIFDEFAWGLVSPQAIKDFLNHAFTNWQSPPPQYVLLAGDTSYDYKDNWNLGTVNYVPGYLIYTEHLGETISDDWLVQVSGADAVPDMYIGRLPANSVQQAADMAAKIVSYETAANTKRWEKKLLLVADNAADSWESVFETMNEDLAALLPSGLPAPERYYLGEYENESLAVSDLTADLLGTINSGALMLAYSGHGSLNIWATERILDNRGGAYRSDVTELANRGMYPFVVNLSCLTGYFIYPSAGAYASPAWLSLAEGFLRPADKGAVAALMPAGMTSTDGQHILSNALTEEIFTHDRRILGAAVAAAKQTLLANGGGDYEEVANTFLFFGDPATSLKVPLPRRPVGLTAQQQGAAVALAWNAALDCNGRAVAGYNLYRRASTEESYSRLNSTPITALSYTDTVTAALTAGEIFYYVVSAVDADGDESVKSEPAVANFSPAIGDDGGGGGGDGGATGGEGGDGGGTGGGGEASGAGAGGGGGCFISSATLCRGLDMWICALAITLICSFSLAKRATAAQRSAPREKSAALEEHPVRS